MFEYLDTAVLNIEKANLAVDNRHLCLLVRGLITQPLHVELLEEQDVPSEHSTINARPFRLPIIEEHSRKYKSRVGARTK